MAILRYIVTDVDRSVVFYQKHFGFALRNLIGSAIANVAKDDLSLWLSGPESSASQPLSDHSRPVPGGWNRFLIQVPDLDARVESLRRENVKFRGEIVAGSGGRRIIVEDPDGNPVELFEMA